MSKRSITTVRFSVKLRLPPGATIKAAKEFLQKALLNQKRVTSSKEPLGSLSLEEITVALLQKETVYL